MTDYLARANDFWHRAAAVGPSSASRWGQRSLEEGNWTVDTITADLIESWEELTPLLGEGIELWLELVQKTINAGRDADG
jgi:hypothetical protein